jgi:GntR family transcriptional regulator
MDDAPGFRPLYRQVYDVLVRQIVEGTLKPAEALPSEQALAAQLGVSQGTVRKALDSMTAEGLVERHQGKGTFVAEHTQERALFRFFRLAYPGGGRAVPTSADEVIMAREASAAEASKLHIAPGTPVFDLQRTRVIDGKAAVRELIVVPQALVPGLDSLGVLPNALYTLYQRHYGLNIVAADEELHADLAGPEDCARLPVGLGAAILHIERVALALDGTRVELRISRCVTNTLIYGVTLR